MAVVRWIFSDLVLSTSYTLAINPKDGATPPVKKNIRRRATSAPDGKTLLFEGQDEVRELEWTGVILTQAHLDALTLWAEKRHQIQVTDDLGRVFTIYIESFIPKREGRVSNWWRHSYSIKAIIVDWP